MDTNLTTICSSSSSSSSSSMENAAVKQFWFKGYYAFSRESITKIRISSPPSGSVNGTTEKKIEKSSSTEQQRIPLCGITLSLVILNLVIILQDFCSSFRCMVSIFIYFLEIFSCIRNACAATLTVTAKRPIQIKLPRDRTETNDRNLSLSEVKKVIEGTLCDLESCKIQENLGLGADKIAGLFEEEEPSLEEVKEAFDLFDENKDGFIDAKELGNVLFSLGFTMMEASEEYYKRMIKGFDDDLDERIDFNEFTKVMETSFR